ncbi:helix-turn-helix transcriptional regulator [Burkholderia contaminans]|uniref:AraC family transcriptional regulator n=3 Tax=Burkholderia contaminans TaxID=488447 RepID=A0A3N8QIF5_9BURK|nr:AraC family transcriptional regulator [Burkholderia contaminans]MEB4635109.1 AraC family transcriptional regulator [Burkholderia contaminans]MEB4641703.1 AraC family transcriptional regulator [Burkholderia contaminans]MEB4656698.1 AraC family transcriptional regulator [Burkholderia contaminans]MEB4664733.1 AraC family transcriptional regulator [Burkholderia contaminans]MEB4672089.1 AraC family transcriptional regulator [Burkholderia contaminans]
MSHQRSAHPGQPFPDDTLAERFLLREAPTVRAEVFSQGQPISFTRLTNVRPQPGRSLTPQPEEAFVFQMPLISSPDPGIRNSSGNLDASTSCTPGACYLLDLRSAPTRRLDIPFDTMRLYLAQSAIEEFTDQKGRRRIGGLVQPSLGASDPVLFRLAHTLQAVLHQPDLTSSLFVDYLALAFCEHVITRYGKGDPSTRTRRASLAPWQMRRIEDFFSAHLQGNPSIADLARQCNLSTSYFGEAFKQTTGSTPHQWLLKRRIERAKSQLRESDASLATIASDCGFFDQSHFSRVFSRLEGCGPKEWRLHNRSR